MNRSTAKGLPRRTMLLGCACALPSLGLLAACGGGGNSTALSGSLTIAPTASSNAVVGDPVMLDAQATNLPTQGNIAINWKVTDPSGAAVSLVDGATLRPYFVATAAGNYAVSLSITLTESVSTGTTPTANLSVTVASAVSLSADDIRSRVRSLAASALPYTAPDSTSPTLFINPPDNATGIANSRVVAWTRPEFIYGGDMQQTGNTYPDYGLGSNRAVSYAADQRSGNYLSIDFVTDAANFEVLQKGLGYFTRMRVVVDGRLANATPLQLPADGAIYAISVRFASKATRQIRLLIDNPAFGGIRVSESDLVTRPTVSTRLRTMFLGDSITEGPAGQDAVSSYAPRTAELLGWTEAWISGVGSTGYLAAPSPKLTLQQRYATDVKAYAPSVLVIAAGVNDTSFSDADIEAEASLLFDQIQADLPNTLVFVAGPWATASRARSSIAAALKAAMGTRANFIYVPNAEEAWFADGVNSAEYISADRTHPTPAGIEYLAGKLSSFIKLAVQ